MRQGRGRQVPGEAVIALLTALAAPLGRLLELALGDDHDEAAQQDAIYELERAIHNERARRKFEAAK